METSCVAGGKKEGSREEEEREQGVKSKWRCVGSTVVYGVVITLPDGAGKNREAGDNIFIRHLKAQSIADP